MCPALTTLPRFREDLSFQSNVNFFFAKGCVYNYIRGDVLCLKLHKLMVFIEYKTLDSVSAVQGEVPTSTNECSNIFRSGKDIFIEQRRMENINSFMQGQHRMPLVSYMLL